MLEQQVPLAAEVSVLLARGADGQVAVYPLAANEHRQGILAVSTVPAAVSPALAEQARAAAVSLAEQLAYRGILCIEFFVLEDGRLLANEMAPRPHNSGHWTLDAADCSQFEQQACKAIGLHDAVLWRESLEKIPTYLDDQGLADYFPLHGGRDSGSPSSRNVGRQALTRDDLPVPRAPVSSTLLAGNPRTNWRVCGWALPWRSRH